MQNLEDSGTAWMSGLRESAAQDDFPGFWLRTGWTWRLLPEMRDEAEVTCGDGLEVGKFGCEQTGQRVL